MFGERSWGVASGRFASRVRAVMLATAMMIASTTAWADPSPADKETARNLLNQGDASYAAGDHTAALKSYMSADQIMGVPTTGLEVAKAQEALGRLVEARDTLLKVMRYPKEANEPRAFSRARQLANERARKLAERIPSVTVSVSGLSQGQSATVKIDGRELISAAVGVPRKLNPGKHTIEVSAAGFADERKEIVVAEKANERVEIALRPTTGAPVPVPPAEPTPTQPEPVAPPPPPPAQPHAAEADTGTSSGGSTLTYVGFGLAGAGLTVGAITGGLAFSKAGTAKDQCVDNVCSADAQSDIDSAKTMGTISTVSFAVGFVGAAVGVYGLLSSSESEPTGVAARSGFYVQPTVGLGNVGVVGQF